MQRTADTQLVLDRPVQTNRQSDTVSTVKTILLHVQDDVALDRRIEAALALARPSSAHLTCIHVTPIEAYVAFDSFGGVFVMNDVMTALDRQETDIRSKIEARLGSEDVSWDYIQVTGNVAAQLIGHAALADLLITGREPHRSDFKSPAVGLLGDLICQSRTPLFIPSDDGRPVDPAGCVLIAWDGGYEAANAVRSSVGLLKLASSVHVLQIKEKEKDEAFPGTRLLEYLSRHDVHAEYSVIEAGVDIHDQAVISDTLAARARALGASYLVMGGYNHSRVGEYIFGGVTRTMLSQAPFPLLIAR
jgi:nucleotide-binding universal stress UspA family protein